MTEMNESEIYRVEEDKEALKQLFQELETKGKSTCAFVKDVYGIFTMFGKITYQQYMGLLRYRDQGKQEIEEFWGYYKRMPENGFVKKIHKFLEDRGFVSRKQLNRLASILEAQEKDEKKAKETALNMAKEALSAEELERFEKVLSRGKNNESELSLKRALSPIAEELKTNDEWMYEHKQGEPCVKHQKLSLE
jgi:ribosomal protein L15